MHNVVRFPVLMMEDVAPRNWEPILTLPLPKNPSLQLLEAARGQVLLYLDWIMHEMIQVDDVRTVHGEIERATYRLREIAEALPAALEAHAEKCLTSISPKSPVEVLEWFNERNGGIAREASKLRIVVDRDLT